MIWTDSGPGEALTAHRLVRGYVPLRQLEFNLIVTYVYHASVTWLLITEKKTYSDIH